jgi:hypothetical protein
MRRTTLGAVTAAGAVALALPIAVLPFIGADAATSKTFTVSPTSGNRTDDITVTSTTKCPSGTTQAHVLAVSHPGESDENVERTDFPVTVASDGSWTTTQKYFQNGPTGKWQLQAGCGDPTQGTDYTPVNFNVTANGFSRVAPSPGPSTSASPTTSPTASPEASPATATGGDANFTG